ncbi:hypothetical protein L207DRAFT_223277 [Hyaloscypha variabilis F]|uniref:Uncharacterized protein n=1 Tax=Hyaloscypha variabilis (strain UAMH 11265 / GT02V1 / F) TaxID=1149755 RepID=A0A2J6QWA9_HYAVF|nr:hypothetical protein L207DRAFT_223277 [Hyaloscypha variabilis F]
MRMHPLDLMMYVQSKGLMCLRRYEAYDLENFFLASTLRACATRLLGASLRRHIVNILYIKSSRHFLVVVLSTCSISADQVPRYLPTCDSRHTSKNGQKLSVSIQLYLVTPTEIVATQHKHYSQ